MYVATRSLAMLALVALCWAGNAGSNDEERQGKDTPLSSTQEDLNGALNIQKRSPKYDFGLGKRAYYVSEFKRLPVYNFGLGKRSIKQYSFGLGKRVGEETSLGDYDDYGQNQEGNDNFEDESNFAENELEDGMSKRGRPYSFGLGKRDRFDDMDGWRETDKRIAARMYNFGLGKRAGKLYSFGLGKRLRPNNQMYSFGLGKRRMTERYNFGMGKRQPALGNRFNFGLGKRSDNELFDVDNLDNVEE